MNWALLALAAAAGAYQLLAFVACIRHLRRRDPAGGALPPVSVLKPVRGLDDAFYDCIRSHAIQDYPEFELLFGVSDPEDPAVAEIERLISEFPCLPIRLIHSRTVTPNLKVAVLTDLAAAARYPVLLVNDSDIRVDPDYLRRVVPPLSDERLGMVTCLYRARAGTLPGRMEAVGIATDFAPSVLVAPLVGVSEFALGSTMVFRAADLGRIGGFAAISEYIADDYQLSARIRQLGLGVLMSRYVVETSLPDETWASVWRHQVRWARTIRVSRGDGYAGLPVTFATLWAILLACAGLWLAAGALFGIRLAAAFTAIAVLRDRQSLRNGWLIPLRDLAAVAVWAAGLLSKDVVWRGRRLKLSRDGRIT